MSSVGVFHEKEINGKPYHIFSLLPQTDNSSSSSSPSLSEDEAIDSGGGDNDLSLETGFFCPNLRRLAGALLNQKECSSDEDIVPFSIPPHFNKETVDQVAQLLLGYGHDQKTCKDPVLPIFWCNNETPNVDGSDLKCFACFSSEACSGYYLCETCKHVFHKECVEAPLSIKKHPSYPSLSLQLYSEDFVKQSCIFCKITLGEMVYYCPIYKVGIHPHCALKPLPIIIDHFKRHPHPLTFFPKQASLACNICGVIKETIPTYICARCVFVVHQDCIYFPYVIRISRHHHRISFTYSLPSGNLSCGVCRRNVDNSYGAYSCKKCDGHYVVHSRCALRKDVWDGEELEGKPEEIEIVEDPFETVADGIILHFSHGHHLNLEIIRDYDEEKYCQACVLPIYEGNYYSCVDDHCDFILHETCANASRKIRHPLHARPLTLKVVSNDYYNVNRGYFGCSACQRKNNGFLYEEDSTGLHHFWLDVRCASISEPFKYEGHEHPLFLALSPDEEDSSTCQICHDHQLRRKLNCIECDFVLCFACATLPYKAKYKHDKHFLTFRKELVATDQSDWCDDQSDWCDDQSDWWDDQSDWCEACEKKIVHSGKGGYYACDEYCCTTLHVDCLLGEDPYLKHGHTISKFRDKIHFHILHNNTLSRPICSNYSCEKRCSRRVYFQRRDLTFCSYNCLRP